MEPEMTDAIKVLLAEDHVIVRKGIRTLLEKDEEIQIVAEAQDGNEALAKAEQLNPDVVVMDITMPLLNGLEATRRIKKYCPDVKVLILTMHTAEEYIFQLLRAGASGYVLKHAAPEELLFAIKAVHRGDTFLSPSIAKTVIDDYILHAEKSAKEDPIEILTSREREILQLLAEGHSNREIAKMLFISVKTVETHRSNLMNKLNLHGIAELVVFAINRGVIDVH
jgi:DNA-binding NarL/FixJ family response regulator